MKNRTITEEKEKRKGRRAIGAGNSEGKILREGRGGEEREGRRMERKRGRENGRGKGK